MTRTQAPATLDRDNPWPGLASFTEAEASWFHGRDGEVAELFDIVRSAGLTILFGQSGLGKTSLLRAGLFPRLRQEDFLPVALRIDYAAAAPPPPEQIRLGLAQAFSQAGVDATAARPDESLWEYFHRRDVDFWSARNRLVTPVLVFDQFEEIFTLGRSSDAARQRGGLLLEELAQLVENRPPARLKQLWDAGEADPSGFEFDRAACKIVLSFREDFLADFDGLRTTLRGILLNRLRLLPMSGSAASEVIDRSGGRLVDAGVTSRIVRFVAAAATSGDESADALAAEADLADLKVEPSLLSVVCSELNLRRRERDQSTITAELLQQSRQGILLDFYERGVADLPASARRFIEERLLTRSGYRSSVALDDALSSDNETPGLRPDLLDRLVVRRLLRVENRLGQQHVELTHDVLVKPVRASRDQRRQRELLAAAARKRRRIIVAAGLALLFLIAAAVTGLMIRHGVIEQQHAMEAGGMVQRLLDADTTQAPAVIGELPPYRRWADPLLRGALTDAGVRRDARRQMHAALGLLPVDAGQVDYLFSRLLDAEPAETPILRDALSPYQAQLVTKLWAALESPGKGHESRRLRAAAALAAYDAGNPRWVQSADALVGDFVQQNPIFLGIWSEALRPVKSSLLAPLSAIYRDHTPEHSADRNLATNLLADYAADDPRVLADLLMDASEKQFAVIYPKFQAQAVPGAAILIGVVDQQPFADADSDAKERLAKRQVNAAVALLQLNKQEKVWPLLRHSPDPRGRSYLIDRLAPLGADPDTIIRRLDVEPDMTVRRALILSLGEFTEDQLPPDKRVPLSAKLLAIYRADPDAGLHSAAEWLLRIWKYDAALADADVKLARKTSEKNLPPWYVNSQKQTMVVIPIGAEFIMASPASEKDHQKDEVQHKVRISRTFAISAKAVTLEQYRASEGNSDYGNDFPEKVSYRPDFPVVGTSWYEAAAYCNWLSAQEGIPPDQQCYVVEDGKVTKLKEHYLSLNGYRLPTEAEMEYVTRAGAVTSRYFGETEELLPKYAWYFANAEDKIHAVGTRKPNDLGLFDVQGDAFTWCQESYDDYPKPEGDAAAEDTDGALVIEATQPRVLRGGSFNTRASFVRSACRYYNVPTYRGFNIGFRLARTFTP